MAAQPSRTARKTEPAETTGDTLVFTAFHYKMIALGVALIVAGFAGMAIEDQWDGFVSLFISPILIVGGFAELAWAIMADPKDKSGK